jgi:pimeloyl-ACP methyl ester carboxylesterase
MSDLPGIGTVSRANIDGLEIRYARSGAAAGSPILITAPWPESIHAFHRVLPQLGSDHPIVAVDLPGFGRSESRPTMMAPEAMGNFVIALLEHFHLEGTHAIAPDVGTPAVLFAAARRPDLFESLVVGGAAALAELAGGRLKALIQSAAGAFAGIDGAEAVKDYLTAAAKLTPQPIVDDFREASAGGRFEAAVQYVRGYASDLPKLEPLLRTIETPVLVIAGRNDPIVPPANGQFLADRLPRRQYVLLDGEHRIWEEAAAEYAGHLRGWINGGYHMNAVNP